MAIEIGASAYCDTCNTKFPYYLPRYLCRIELALRRYGWLVDQVQREQRILCTDCKNELPKKGEK